MGKSCSEQRAGWSIAATEAQPREHAWHTLALATNAGCNCGVQMVGMLASKKSLVEILRHAKPMLQLEALATNAGRNRDRRAEKGCS